MTARVRVDGKQFSCGDRRFVFRGVTYGTFKARADGHLFPETTAAKADMIAMAESGFTVVRTYTAPPRDLLDLAADWNLKILAGVYYPDWRYLIGGSRRQQARMLRDARHQVRRTAGRLAGREEVLGLCLGNEVPADVVRWFGTDRVARALSQLASVARDQDPDLPITYGNYPSTEYLPNDEMDFLVFNVFLEDPVQFRRYLNRLHHLAGERPLVLGEMGLHAGSGEGGEEHQATVVDWQMQIALERGVAGTCLFSWTDDWWVDDRAVEGWHFGLTRTDRSPRPALDVAACWNGRTVADLPMTWPSISVVICAYNATSTLDECLRHACSLDYPKLEVIVVDDGSTDDTAAIAERYPRVRLLRIPHAGLAVARNEGFAAATGELIAYLDSDAFPTPEWPYYLALGLDGPRVGGVGGPNVPPPQDPPGAHRVARAPGGPLHVLISDDRAEHVPGCNMAFWKDVLHQIGGFDPIYTAAGDDVDLCWRILDTEWEIAFHPAALVWHHRRSGARPYLRQQLGYGRAEALVHARHPDRFTAAGSARWRGHIYSSLTAGGRTDRIYRGLYGAAAYQSVYRGSQRLDLAHQLGVPLAAAALLTLPLGILRLLLLVPGLVALSSLLALGAADAAAVRPPRNLRRGRLGFRIRVAVLCLLQPIVRTWGRRRSREQARRGAPPAGSLPGPVQEPGGGVCVLPEVGSRTEIVAAVMGQLRQARIPIVTATGWEDHDAALLASVLVQGRLVTSSHPPGTVQLRVRRQIRRRNSVLVVGSGAVLALIGAWAALAALVAISLFDLLRGLWRSGRTVRRIIRESANRNLADGR